MENPGFEQVQAAAAFVRERVPGQMQRCVGVVLGSGLGAFADTLEHATSVDYAEIPHFPQSGVSGHRSRLVAGKLGDVGTLAMQGRVHMYEGYSPQQVVFPIRVLMALGAKAVVVTNAAGGIADDFAPGDLMLISDHLNLTGRNPLCGTNDDRFGPRFPDLSDTYSAALRTLAHEVAAQQGFTFKQGVYAGLLGPSYETPAEIQMLKALGASAVGMSTVVEAIAAAHAGIPVLGISCITNLAAGIAKNALSHDEVKETADRVRSVFVGLLRQLIPVVGRAV